MNKIFKKLPAIALSLLLSINITSISAFAEETDNNDNQLTILKLYTGHSTDDINQIPSTSSAITLTEDGTYTISGNGSLDNNIIIGSDENSTAVTLYLDGVDIQSLSDNLSAVYINPLSTANIIICGNVSLTGGEGGCGIAVPENANVTISGNSDNDKLTVEGVGKWACGIGWFDKGYTSSGSIIINNLNELYATGGFYGIDMTSENGTEGGPAIGGGRKDGQTGGSIILDNIGTVEAFGGSKSAGIGAGFWEACDITISNCGNVVSYGGATGAGIGFSRLGNVNEGGYTLDGTVNIQNCKNITAYGGYEAAGIGNGSDYKNLLKGGALPEDFGNLNVIIDNSTVNAFGGNSGAGIGGGYKAWNVSVNICNGSNVYAVGGKHESKTTLDQNSAAGIGSGADGSIIGYTDNVKSYRTISIDSSSQVRAASNGGKWAIDIGYEITGDAVIAQGRFISSTFLTKSYKDGAQYDPASVLATSDDGEILSDSTDSIQVGGQKVILPAGYICVGATQLSSDTIYVTADGYKTNTASYIPGSNSVFKPNTDEVSADFTLKEGLNSFDYLAFRPEVNPTPTPNPTPNTPDDTNPSEEDNTTDIDDNETPLNPIPEKDDIKDDNISDTKDSETVTITDDDIPMASNPATGYNDAPVLLCILIISSLFVCIYVFSEKKQNNK